MFRKQKSMRCDKRHTHGQSQGTAKYPRRAGGAVVAILMIPGHEHPTAGGRTSARLIATRALQADRKDSVCATLTVVAPEDTSRGVQAHLKDLPAEVNSSRQPAILLAVAGQPFCRWDCVWPYSDADTRSRP
jgi:hypothetical protein